MESRDTPKEGDHSAGNTATPKSSIYGRPGLGLRTEGVSDTSPRFALKPSLGASQSQSQGTLRGDPSAHYPILPSNFDELDSDREETSPAFSTPAVMRKPKKPLFDESDDGQPGPSDKREGKQREHAAVRRYTIEPGNVEGDVLLTDITQDEANAIHAVVSSSEDFMRSANASPEEWRNAIQNMIESVQVCRENLAVLQQDNDHLTKGTAEARAKARAIADQLRDANARATKEEQSSARIRRLRDKYREVAEDLHRENEQLKATAAAMASGHLREEEDQDSDVDSHHTEVQARYGAAPPSNLRGGSNRHNTPGTGTGTVAVTEGALVSKNKRYPDVPNFHGSKDDKHKWDGWRMHLYSKFNKSAAEFPTEEDKIDYVRDRCKDAAFDVIKTRADNTYANPNPYLTVEEMVAELDAMFGTYDKVAKSDNELHDPNFAMGVKDKKETFETFYARFMATIAPLNYGESLRISTLKRLLNQRLKYKISGETFKTYPELLARLRHVSADLEAIDKSHPKDNSNRSGGGQGPSGQSQRNNNAGGNGNRPGNPRQGSSYRGTGYQYPKTLKDRIMKENRCWKCLKTGHRSFDNNAPCKDADPLTKEQVEIMMKTVGVEVTEEEQNPTELPEKSEN